MEEATATEKAIVVLYFALEMTARKMIADEFPTKNIVRITVTELLKNCKEYIETPRKETLDRFKFLF